jgi:hypothetical protein
MADIKWRTCRYNRLFPKQSSIAHSGRTIRIALLLVRDDNHHLRLEFYIKPILANRDLLNKTPDQFLIVFGNGGGLLLKEREDKVELNITDA